MYQTGTASDVSDFLAKLAAFAATAGYTIDENVAVTGGRRVRISKGTLFIGLNGQPSYIEGRGATGAATGSTIDLSPGATSWSARAQPLPEGPFTRYEFFSDAEGHYVHAVLEQRTGFFKHILFGTVEPLGDFIGGHYFEMSNSNITTLTERQNANSTQNHYPFDAGRNNAVVQYNGGISVEADGQVWRRIGFASASAYDAFGTLRAGGNEILMAASPSNFDFGVTPLPITIYSERANPNAGDVAPVGQPRDVCSVWLEGMNPRQELTIGGDTWICYPIVHQEATVTAGSVNENSWQYGLAYRKRA